MKKTKQGVRDLGGNVRPTKTVGKTLPEPPKQHTAKDHCPHLGCTTTPDGTAICSVCLEDL